MSLEQVLLKVYDNHTDEVEVRWISDVEEHELNHQLGFNSDDLRKKHFSHREQPSCSDKVIQRKLNFVRSSQRRRFENLILVDSISCFSFSSYVPSYQTLERKRGWG